MALSQENTRVIKQTTTGAVTTEMTFIRGMNWSGTDKVATDVLIVTDTAGNEIWKTVCSVNGDDNAIVFNHPLPVTGVTVGTMTSDHGDFYLYIE